MPAHSGIHLTLPASKPTQLFLRNAEVNLAKRLHFICAYLGW